MLSVIERVKKLRSSSEYKKWRTEVFARDKGKCQKCGSDEKVEVDHIKPLALNPESALDIKNGRVLCEKCHKKTDTFGSLSRYKGEGIHPILSGDFLIKIKSLPVSIKIKGKDKGLSIHYIAKDRLWKIGYPKLCVLDEDIEVAFDKLFSTLRKASLYSFEKELVIFSAKEKNMHNNKNSTQQERIELYAYLERLLMRKLTDEERSFIGTLFSKGVRKYHENIMNNL